MLPSTSINTSSQHLHYYFTLSMYSLMYHLNAYIDTPPPPPPTHPMSTIVGSFYGVYSKISLQYMDDEYRHLNYSMSACSGPLGICPKSGSTAYCPCISTTSTMVCASQSCSLPSDQATLPCTKFAASQVGYCYCEAKLTALLSSSASTIQTAQQLKTYLYSSLPQDCGNYLQVTVKTCCTLLSYNF